MSKKFIIKVLDNVEYKSPRTYNNFLKFIRLFCNFLIERDYLHENPAQKIKKIPDQVKKREEIPDDLLNRIFDYLKSNDNAYLLICYFTYYLFLRPKEILSLQVKHIDLEKNLITTTSEFSKNKKNENVTIPNFLIDRIKNYLKNNNNLNHFVFSKDMMPGDTALGNSFITKKWSRYRTILKFGDVYQFYSLKDTGIKKFLNSNIPSISVKNQARHSDLSITEKYIQKNKGADQNIIDLDY